ncbi:MAG: hypothetical protein H7240_00790 [Glaciimonas sp.]|nr:hypothetical protein [Glaciimonas sp.]
MNSTNLKKKTLVIAPTALINVINGLVILPTPRRAINSVTHVPTIPHVFNTKESPHPISRKFTTSVFRFPSEIAKAKIPSIWRVDNRDYCQIEDSKEVLIRARLNLKENAMFRAIDIDRLSRKILHIRINHITNKVIEPHKLWFVEDNNYAYHFTNKVSAKSLLEESVNAEDRFGKNYQRIRCMAEAWNDLWAWYDDENRFSLEVGKYINTMTANIANKIADEMLNRVQKEKVSRLGCEIESGLAASPACIRGERYIGRIDGGGVLHNLPPIAFCEEMCVRFRRFLPLALTLADSVAMEELEISDFPLLTQLQLDFAAENLTVSNNLLLENIHGFAAAKKNHDCEK